MNDRADEAARKMMSDIVAEGLLKGIKDLRAVGQGHLAYFGRPIHWNHLRANTEAEACLCGEKWDKLSSFVPISQGVAEWCPDCRRVFRESGYQGTL